LSSNGSSAGATAPPSLRLELADVVDAREIVLDGEIAVPNYRGVTDIDDLQYAIAGTGRLEPESRPGWQGPALAPSGSPLTRR
jgi:hypothetical protein